MNETNTNSKHNKPQWQQEAEEMLRNYGQWKRADTIQNLKNQIESLNVELYSPATFHTSPVPIHGGGNKYENNLINKMDRCDRLKKQLKCTELNMQTIERGLEVLSENELKVLNIYYINRLYGKNPINVLMENNSYSKSEIYRQINHALTRFAININGCIEI